MTAAEQTRHGEGAQAMRTAVRKIEAVAGGYRLGFGVEEEQIVQLAEFVAGERRCCNFLTFNIEAAADGAGLWLNMTGPAGTAQFLQRELALGD